MKKTEETFQKVKNDCVAQQVQAQQTLRSFKEKLHQFTCVNCGGTFSLTSGEIFWYQNHGLDYPKRCYGCRGHYLKTF